MPHLHPLRSTTTNATVFEIGARLSAAADARDEIEDSVATVAAVGEMLDRMQTQIEEQVAQIAGLRKEVRDLSVHKEAAFGEMTKAEAAMRAERERADRAERLCQQLTASEREAQEKIKRLVLSVRNTFFKRAEPMASAAAG